MSSSTPIGYCPKCQQNVLLKRKDIDICLALILLIFTAGIGLIIYLIVYYSTEKNRCIHCGTIITSSTLKNPPISERLPYFPKELEKESSSLEVITGETPSFCPLCGESLDGRDPLLYCPNCGTKI